MKYVNASLAALCCTLSLYLAAPSAYAQNAADSANKTAARGKMPAVPTVNGKQLPKPLIDAAVAAAIERGQPDSAELRQGIYDNLVTLELLDQAAQKAGMDKRSEVAAQIQLARATTLANAYVANYVKNHPISDAVIQREYDKARSQAANEKEYRARHILVDSREQAQKIIDKLKKGDKFEELAKESKDEGSKASGGELGWVSPKGLVKPFAEAMVALKKGEITQTPVKTDFGYHVIELEDIRDVQIPSLEAVKAQFQRELQQRQVSELIAQLRKNATIK